ncbi:delta-aminolevulinic acid dehydratase-like [Homalodisca vitripennis]|uniref:delta-aminolevulinic acid dehydratase-like n=1 Tax=Homalodisca vitripennis TaxID=197043 RepID=UPI001EEADB52|nr:delta-aminolevulinic acid dehydratase-like [Homalodisca vitripennis]
MHKGDEIRLQTVTLHSSIFHPILRKWQSVQSISSDNIVYPVFVVDIEDAKLEVDSMPGVYRYGINRIIPEIKPLVEKGLKSVLLFGVITQLSKDTNGSSADSKDNPVLQAVPMLRSSFPDLVIACDVCLCSYTNHGHCGILRDNGSIHNELSIKRLAEVAVAYAKAGCHIVAPSDMMDGRVLAIKNALREAQMCSSVSLLSYAVKFASAFYGPFREASKSSPAFGNRKAYQLPPGSSGLAARAASRDVDEGCDLLMVKPGIAYLDILRQTKQAYPNIPLFVYQVSGEYAMLYHAAKAGSFSLEDGVAETLTAFRRAGADCIITYFAPLILDMLAEGKL